MKSPERLPNMCLPLYHGQLVPLFLRKLEHEPSTNHLFFNCSIPKEWPPLADSHIVMLVPD